MDMLRELVRSVAGRENVVYTPILTYRETECFRVYVSPKMCTHVLVGPFKATATNDGGETPATRNVLIPKIYQVGLPGAKLTEWPLPGHVLAQASPPDEI